MPADRTPPPSPPPAGGDAHGAHARRALVALALVAVVGGVAWLLWPSAERAIAMTDPSPGQPASVPDANGKATTQAPLAAARPATAAAPGATRDLAEVLQLAPGQRAPAMGEVIARLRAEGIHDGLAAFNPPGTSPPLVGLAVPEDFPLPEGYVRHHQTTDDGQDIEAILMYSPDYDFYDADGRPIPIPPDRVVPPSMAPPGLPLRQVRIPPPRDAQGGVP